MCDEDRPNRAGEFDSGDSCRADERKKRQTSNHSWQHEWNQKQRPKDSTPPELESGEQGSPRQSDQHTQNG